MNPQRWQQVKEILHAATEREPQERAAFIATSCVDDDVRREVESLLEYETSVEHFIEESVFSVAGEVFVEKEMAGQRIGHYRIEREIGRGGMGAVFLGVRADDQYRKQVAIKFIKRGMDTDAILRRFRNERQILANLDHPNIARLLDGGSTADGLPYLVMEYIQGESIIDYCDHHKLSINERLELFRKVCAAVQFAHQNLIIHRDIKPSNILVTPDGTPKLLDFGIAKLLNPQTGVEPSAAMLDATATGLLAMTPEYASPEQICGGRLTTATDVYSLGVVLYELLSGRRLHRFTSRRPDEIARVICDTQPERPSFAVCKEAKGDAKGVSDDNNCDSAQLQKISETRGETSALRLRRRLRGDLDNIVLMALRREPVRRYASVEQFSEDIRRHTENLPIVARKSSLVGQARKFIERNKTGAIAAALILVTLVAGIAATMYQARRAAHQAHNAERRLSELRGLTNSLMFELSDEIDRGPTQARIVLVRKASEYLNRFSQETNGDSSVQHELATSYLKLGDLQGRPYRPNIGDSAGALVSYRHALQLLEPLAASDSANVEIQSATATAYERIGFLSHRMGESGEAKDYTRRALMMREALWASDKSNHEYRRRLADSYIYLGDVAIATRQEEIIKRYRRALELREELAREEPSNTQNLRDVAQALQRIGNLKLADDDAAHNRESWESNARALRLREQVAASSSANVQDQRSLADQLMLTGDSLLRLGKANEAIENYERALELFRSLAMTDPANAEARRDLSFVYLKLGQAKTQTNAAARDHLLNAMHIAQELHERDPNREDLSTLHAIYEEFARSAEIKGRHQGRAGKLPQNP